MTRPILTAFLLALLAAACDSPVEPRPVLADPRVGDEYLLNVQFGAGLLCSRADRDLRTGRVMAVSERAVILADVDNPAGGYTDAEYEALGGAFDEDIWRVVTHYFGAPHDIDGNGRVALFFTRAVNELAPPGQLWFVGGVTAARDLFPPEGSSQLGACPGSNYAELIYMPVPDPEGVVNGNVRPKGMEQRRALNLMAHELQHVVNASRRLHSGGPVGADWNEEVWLNEGLSHIAEELVGYATSDLAPRQNINIDWFIGSQSRQAAFETYMQPNFQWLAHFLEAPDTASFRGADGRATRGAAWQFLRYAADRKGGGPALWSTLTAPGASGFANLERSFDMDPPAWLHDWLIGVYADDLVSGLPARFRHPSWNFRDLYPYLRALDGSSYGRYPLDVLALVDGAELSLTIPAGSAAFAEFGVAAGERAEIRTSAAAPSCRAGGPARSLGVGEVVFLTAAEVEAVCLDAGAGAAEYGYIPFLAAEGGALHLTVRASGIGGAPAGDLSGAGAASAARADALADWELGFRASERSELAALVAGGGVATPQAWGQEIGSAIGPATGSPAGSGSGSGSGLRVAIVRVR